MTAERSPDTSPPSKEQQLEWLAKGLCMNCGKKGPHYIPPSFGDEGFFACEAFNNQLAEQPLVEAPVPSTFTPSAEAVKLAATVLGKPSPVWDGYQWIQAATLLARELTAQPSHVATPGWRFWRTGHEVKKTIAAKSPEGREAFVNELDHPVLYQLIESMLSSPSATLPASAERGTVTVTVEFIQVAQSMAEAVRWVLQDAAYKAPEQVGPVAERWIARLRGVESLADTKLNAAVDGTTKEKANG